MTRSSFLFACLLFVCITANATVRYVKPGGTGDGSNWGNASGNLQAMLNASASGDEIWVAAGTYLPENRAGDGSTDRERAFVLVSNIKIYGGFPATGDPVFTDRNWLTNRTVLSGDLGTPNDPSDNALHVVIASRITNTVVDGFVITGGNADISSGRTVVNSEYIDKFGGGAWFNASATPTLENISFENNSAISGGAWYNKRDNAVLNRVYFRGNVATDGGAYYGWVGTTKISNTVLSGNKAARGGAWYNNGGTPTFDNCTFSGNMATTIGGAWYHQNGIANVRNSIIWGNSAPTDPQISGYPLLGNNIIQGSPGGVGLNIDPKFNGAVAASSAPTLAGDYTISAVSGLVNAGDALTNTASYAIQVGNIDLAGNPRIQKNQVDLGAYETAFLPPITPTYGVVYVKKNGAGNLTGSSWTNAVPELADALLAAKTNPEIARIWVAAGTYKPLYHPVTGAYSLTDRDNAFVLLKDVWVVGGFTANPAQHEQRNLVANPTILSGDIGIADDPADNAHHVVIASGNITDAVLDGFIITNGNANGTGSITVNGEVVSRENGGGMIQVNNNMPVKYTVFSRNQANYGAAISTKTGSMTITNGLFRNNTALSTGGAIYSTSGTVKVYNSTFHLNNSASGNTVYTSAAPEINGCIFYDNVTGPAADVYSVSGTPNITYSLTPISVPGTGNIVSAASPFISNDEANADYARLKTGSPALNTGDPLANTDEYAVQLSYWDLSYTNRIQRGRVDMGAYESSIAVQPGAITEAATSVFYTTATLNAKVDDRGSNTTVSFEYDTSPAFTAPQSISASPASISAETGETAVNASLSGLTTTTPYYFRVKAVNSAGTTYGSTLNFTSLTLVTPPSITSFTPESGAAGIPVVITGANFSVTPIQNDVYFGAVKATVTAASATSLTVTVPAGTTYQFIRVVNLDTKVTGYANKPFILTFPAKDLIKANDFATKLDFNLDDPTSATALADLNGDGKPEMIVADEYGVISFFRNKGTAGSIVAATFASRLDHSGNSDPKSIVVTDLDADGKPDILVNYFASWSGTGGFYVLRNTSASATSLSFDDQLDFSSEESWVYAIAAGDIDGDGKPDVAVANFQNGQVAVLQNISTGPGVIAFAAPVMFTTASNTGYLALADLNNDGKPELIAARETASTVYVFRNTSTPGVINSASFAPRTTLTAAGQVSGLVAGDLDKDGYNDLAVACYSNARISIFRNTTTVAGGGITFGSKVDLTTPTRPYAIAIADMNGDALPDLLTANSGGNSFSTFQSKAQPGTLALTSFEAKVDVSTGSSTAPGSIAVGDIDGDAKPDVVIGNTGFSRVSVFRSLVQPAITVSTMERLNVSTNNASSVQYKVTFSRAPATVTAAGFALTTTGTISGASITSVTGSAAVYTVTLNTGTGEGTIRLDVKGTGTGIVDAQANPPKAYTAGDVYTIDRTLPTLSAVSIASDNAVPALAKTGDEVILTFTASEILSMPSVTIAGHSVTATNSTVNTWNAVYTFAETDAEGPVTFAINFTDLAGNAGTEAVTTIDASTVTFDRTSPGTPAGLTVLAGDEQNTITWTALTTPDLSTYQLYGGTGPIPTTLLATIPAGTLTYTHTALANGTTYYYRLTATDQAGNISTTSTDVTGKPMIAQTLTFAATNGAVYGTPDFDPGATSVTSAINPVTYTSSNTDAVTILSGKLHIAGVGVSIITASQGGNSTYTPATDVTQTFTVTPRPVTITAAAVSKVYGEDDPGLTYTFAPALVGSDSFSGTLARTTGESKGTYPINQHTLTPGSNYSVTYEPAGLTITARPLTVTAAAGSKIYGEPDPALTYTFTPALVPGDNFSGALSRADGENKGTYAIDQNTLTAGNNYQLAYQPALFSITAKPVTVTAATQAKTYGETDPAFTYAVSPALITGDNFSGTPDRTPGENKGTYLIHQGTLTPGSNYEMTFQTADLTIAAKPVTVTASAAAKVYGETDPALTYTVTPALKSGDSFTGNLARQVGEDKGTYTIHQNTLTPGDNYTVSYQPADLAISAKPVTVSATAQFKIYGETDPYLTYTVTPALITGDSFSGTLSRINGENKGTYTIHQHTLTPGNNYLVTYQTADLTISAKPITISAAPKGKTYGETDPALTFQVTPALLNGDRFTGNLSRAGGEATGTYTIRQNTLTPGSNYSVTYEPADLTISAKTVTVTATAGSKIYGETDPAFAYTFAPALVNGDSFTGTLSRVNGENKGSYAIGQNTLTAGSNYALIYEAATFSITAKPVTVSATAQTKIYGDTDPYLTYTVAPSLLTGDTFSGTLSRESGENKGTYAVGMNTLTAGDNYTISYQPASFTIAPKPITLTAATQSKVYGETDPSLAYTFAPALVNGDSFSGVLSRISGENTGTYTINQHTLTPGANYTVTYQPADLAITRKALLIAAEDKSRLQATANPSFTFSYDGFINGENNTVLTTQPAASTSATDTSPVGNYPIVPTGAVARNYSISYANGTLRIVQEAVNGLTFSPVQLYENNAAGTLAGTLTASSNDPNAVFTYALTSGTGDADNARFTISGNQVRISVSTDYETKSEYSLRVKCTTALGVSAETMVTVRVLDVNETPALNPVANQAVCYTTAQQSIALTGISAGPEIAQTVTVSVSSNLPGMFSSLAATVNGSSGELRYVAAPGQSGTALVTVTVKDNGGTANSGTDTFSRTFSITVNPLPVISISSSSGALTISKGETIVLQANGGTTYSWQGTSGIVSGQATAALSVRPAQSATYTVAVTNASGCTEQQTVRVEVLEDYRALNRANILTPNGDGVNDTWVVENIDLYPNNQVLIVDRSGRTVYQKKTYDNSWQGTLDGAPLAEGTYYYIIDFGPGTGQLKGFITIIRNQ